MEELQETQTARLTQQLLNAEEDVAPDVLSELLSAIEEELLAIDEAEAASDAESGHAWENGGSSGGGDPHKTSAAQRRLDKLLAQRTHSHAEVAQVARRIRRTFRALEAGSPAVPREAQDARRPGEPQAEGGRDGERRRDSVEGQSDGSDAESGSPSAEAAADESDGSSWSDADDRGSDRGSGAEDQLLAVGEVKAQVETLTHSTRAEELVLVASWLEEQRRQQEEMVDWCRAAAFGSAASMSQATDEEQQDILEAAETQSVLEALDALEMEMGQRLGRFYQRLVLLSQDRRAQMCEELHKLETGLNSSAAEGDGPGGGAAAAARELQRTISRLKKQLELGNKVDAGADGAQRELPLEQVVIRLLQATADAQESIRELEAGLKEGESRLGLEQEAFAEATAALAARQDEEARLAEAVDEQLRERSRWLSDARAQFEAAKERIAVGAQRFQQRRLEMATAVLREEMNGEPTSGAPSPPAEAAAVAAASLEAAAASTTAKISARLARTRRRNAELQARLEELRSTADDADVDADADADVPGDVSGSPRAKALPTQPKVKAGGKEAEKEKAGVKKPKPKKAALKRAGDAKPKPPDAEADANGDDAAASLPTASQLQEVRAELARIAELVEALSHLLTQPEADVTACEPRRRLDERLAPYREPVLELSRSCKVARTQLRAAEDAALEGVGASTGKLLVEQAMEAVGSLLPLLDDFISRVGPAGLERLWGQAELPAVSAERLDELRRSERSLNSKLASAREELARLSARGKVVDQGDEEALRTGREQLFHECECAELKASAAASKCTELLLQLHEQHETLRAVETGTERILERVVSARAQPASRRGSFAHGGGELVERRAELLRQQEELLDKLRQHKQHAGSGAAVAAAGASRGNVKSRAASRRGSLARNLVAAASCAEDKAAAATSGEANKRRSSGESTPQDEAATKADELLKLLEPEARAAEVEKIRRLSEEAAQVDGHAFSRAYREVASLCSLLSTQDADDDGNAVQQLETAQEGLREACEDTKKRKAAAATARMQKAREERQRAKALERHASAATSKDDPEQQLRLARLMLERDDLKTQIRRSLRTLNSWRLLWSMSRQQQKKRGLASQLATQLPLQQEEASSHIAQQQSGTPVDSPQPRGGLAQQQTAMPFSSPQPRSGLVDMLRSASRQLSSPQHRLVADAAPSTSEERIRRTLQLLSQKVPSRSSAAPSPQLQILSGSAALPFHPGAARSAAKAPSVRSGLEIVASPSGTRNPGSGQRLLLPTMGAAASPRPDSNRCSGQAKSSAPAAHRARRKSVLQARWEASHASPPSTRNVSWS